MQSVPNNYKSLNGISKEKQIAIFDAAIKKIQNPSAFSGEVLWSQLFSKKHASGFEPIWQRATHLITSQGDLLKTEDYSINFIFEDPHSNHQYQFLYEGLPYVMIYLTSIALECFNRILKMNEHTYNHMSIISMGCYEALFMKGNRSKLIDSLNKGFVSYLKCIHCKKDVRINKKNAPAMYIRDQLICNKCGLQSSFPFYWFLSQSTIAVIPDADSDQAQRVKP